MLNGTKMMHPKHIINLFTPNEGNVFIRIEKVFANRSIWLQTNPSMKIRLAPIIMHCSLSRLRNLLTVEDSRFLLHT